MRQWDVNKQSYSIIFNRKALIKAFAILLLNIDWNGGVSKKKWEKLIARMHIEASAKSTHQTEIEIFISKILTDKMFVVSFFVSFHAKRTKLLLNFELTRNFLHQM